MELFCTVTGHAADEPVADQQGNPLPAAPPTFSLVAVDTELNAQHDTETNGVAQRDVTHRGRRPSLTPAEVLGKRLQKLRGARRLEETFEIACEAF